MKKYLILGSIAIAILTISGGCSTSNDYRCESNDLCSSTSEWKYYSCSNDTGHCEKVDPLAVDPSTVSDAVVGQSDYSVTLTASGGIPPYTWSLARGDEEKLKWLTLTPEGDNKAILHNSTGTNNEPIVPTDLNNGIPLTLTITLLDSSRHGTAFREDNQGKAFQMTITIDDCPHTCKRYDGNDANLNDNQCTNDTQYTCISYPPTSPDACVKWDAGTACTTNCDTSGMTCCSDECVPRIGYPHCTDGQNGGEATLSTCDKDNKGCFQITSAPCSGPVCTSDYTQCGECKNIPNYCSTQNSTQCINDLTKIQKCLQYETTSCFAWVTEPCNSYTSCQNGNCIYTVGTTGAGGGKIFWVDSSSSHYMEVTTSDQGTAQWGCSGTAIPGSYHHEIGAGKTNTDAIVSACGDNGIAAKLCYGQNLGNGYTDWFLPSLDELYQVYLNKNSIGIFSHVIYWSSSGTPSDATMADTVVLTGTAAGFESADFRTVSGIYVRCVRSGP